MRRNLVPWLAGCQASPWLHNLFPIVPETLSRPNQSDLPLLMGVGGGAGAGTVVGAIAAGGKGALIGGPVGAGAGTAVAFLTGKKDIRLPPETSLTFKLAEPVTIRPKG